MNSGMLLRSMQVGPSRRPWAHVLMSPSAWSFLEHGRTCPEGDDLRRKMLECVLRVCNVDLDKVRNRLRNEGHTELEAIVGTIAETLLEQGEVRGRAATFMNQARIKFGDVPAARADEVRAADAATLDRWLEALIGADTLDEVFDSRRRH